MRNKEEIQQKIRLLRKKYFSEFCKARLADVPENCVYNNKVRINGHGKVRFCKNKDFIEKRNGWSMVVCEGSECTCDGKFYKCKYAEESVSKEFREILMDPSRCGEVYPKLAILLWFAGGQMEKDDGRLCRFSKIIGSLLRLEWW